MSHQPSKREISRKMTELAYEIADMSGDRSNTRISDIKDVLSYLSVILIDEPEWLVVLDESGKRIITRRDRGRSVVSIFD
jgi:hypothetical protein